jgi:hypothetical protein
MAGWLSVAVVCLAAVWPPHHITLAAWTPVVVSLVDLGTWLRAVVALVPSWSLWAMTTLAAVAVSGGVVGRSRGSAGWLTRAAVGAALLAAWMAAASGRPAVAAIAGGVVAIAVAAGPSRGSRAADTATLRALVPWIVVLAAVIRLWSLESLPPGFGTHGSTHLALAVDLLDGARDALGDGEVPASVWVRYGMAMAWRDQHGPLAVVHAFGFAVLGVGYVEARLTTALLGVATVWLVTVFGVWIGRRRLGVAAAALLAVAPWHVTFSRGNDAEHVLSPLHAILALGLLARAVRRGGWMDWLAAGVAMGLSVYLYAPNQLVPVMGVVYLTAVASSARGWLRRDATRIGTSAIVACAVALPFVAVWLRSPVPLPIRSSVDSTATGNYAVSRPDDLAPNLAEATRQMFVASDDQWLWSPTGMLGPATVALWIAGLAVCTVWLRRRSTRPEAALLLALLTVGLLPGLLSAWVFARRLILAATAVELIAAAGLVWVASPSRGGGRSRVTVTTAAIVAIVAHVAVGWAISVRAVTVPESLASTVYPVLARLVSESIPSEPVLIVIDRGEPFTDVEDAIRLGAAPTVRPLLEAGHARRNLWRVVEVEDVPRALDELSSVATSARVVVLRHGPGGPEEALAAVLVNRRAQGPVRVWDVRGHEVARAWRIPSPTDRGPGPARSVPDSVGR